MKMIKGIVLLLAVFSATSHAQLQWGGAGHAITAAIANAFLGKNASQLCKNLLPEVKGDIAQVASWADDVKHSAGYQWSGNLHFINTPDWNCSYIRPRDCNDRTYGSNYCVDTAVQNYTGRLNNQRGQQQIEALKFLVHFVGDIHQPLHVGFTTDAGGNTISGTFERTSTNLHAIWDTHIIAKRITDDFSGSQSNYVNYFVKQLNGPWAQQADQWRKCSSGTFGNACSPQWASESIGLACSNAYVEADGKRPVPNNFRLADPYYTRNLPIIEQQLAKGGIRLANVLNTLAPGLLSKP